MRGNSFIQIYCDLSGTCKNIPAIEWLGHIHVQATYLASLGTGINTRSADYPVRDMKINKNVNCPEVVIINFLINFYNGIVELIVQRRLINQLSTLNKKWG